MSCVKRSKIFPEGTMRLGGMFEAFETEGDLGVDGDSLGD